MFKVGTVCVKIAGRDAGKSCVVVEELDKGMVLVDLPPQPKDDRASILIVLVPS
jgi:ribosomal protein L14E/L6E/L27E